MVGGWIIQVSDAAPGISELWCMDSHGNETAVRVETEQEMPKVGDEIWWQSGKVYWDGDRRSLAKIANSYTPGASS